MTFGEVLNVIGNGGSYSRPGGEKVDVFKPTVGPNRPFLQIHHVDGTIEPYTPSPIDMFASDWQKSL